MRPPPAAVPINADMNASNAELRLVDRSGTGSRVGAARLFSSLMALNPVDSRILAASILDPRAGTQDLGLMDLTKDSMAPLTATRGFAGYPVWSADGRRLAYAYQPPGGLDDVYIKDIATGLIQPVIESPGITEHPLAWSHDAKSLLIFGSGDNGTYLSAWSFASRTLTRFVGPRAVETPACFSPHDDLVAFTSQESGRPEVYVATFPDHRRTWPVTTEGGRALSWRNDGREILVATLSGHIVAYPVSTEGGFSHGQPTTLVRDVGYLGGLQHGRARSFPHPHSRQSGRGQGQGRDSVALRVAGRAAPGQGLVTVYAHLLHQRHEARLGAERIEDGIPTDPRHHLRIGRERPLEVVECARVVAKTEMHERQVERQHLAIA